MKKLILIFTLFYSHSFAQVAQDEDSDTPVTAGDFLIKSNQQHINGTIIGVLGIGISSGMLISNPKEPAAAFVVLGLSSITSTILYFLAWNNIKIAGEKMNEKRLSLNTSKGIGLCYKF